MTDGDYQNETDKTPSTEQCPLAMTFSTYCARNEEQSYGMNSAVKPCCECHDGFPLPTWKNNQDKATNSLNQNVFLFCLPLCVFFFSHSSLSLITHIILLPSTKMRHQFLCQWELQISFELALEEMGGDRSERRRRDKLMSMFELALARSGRETMLGNLRDFRRQIVVF